MNKEEKRHEKEEKREEKSTKSLGTNYLYYGILIIIGLYMRIDSREIIIQLGDRGSIVKGMMIGLGMVGVKWLVWLGVIGVVLTTQEEKVREIKNLYKLFTVMVLIITIITYNI